MALAALIIASIVDVALVVLIAGVPGAINIWPAGMGVAMLASLTALLVFCLIAPIVGFALRYFGRPVGGILIAWLPPAVWRARPPSTKFRKGFIPRSPINMIAFRAGMSDFPTHTIWE